MLIFNEYFFFQWVLIEHLTYRLHYLHTFYIMCIIIIVMFWAIICTDWLYLHKILWGWCNCHFCFMDESTKSWGATLAQDYKTETSLKPISLTPKFGMLMTMRDFYLMFTTWIHQWSSYLLLCNKPFRNWLFEQLFYYAYESVGQEFK